MCKRTNSGPHRSCTPSVRRRTERKSRPRFPVEEGSTLWSLSLARSEGVLWRGAWCSGRCRPWWRDKNLVLDILREMFVVELERGHPDFQVCVVNRGVGAGVGGGGVGTGRSRGPRVGVRWLRGECDGGRYPLSGGGGSMRFEFEARGLELNRAKCLEWTVSSAAVAAWPCVPRVLALEPRLIFAHFPKSLCRCGGLQLRCGSL